jgi:hypothetical protein
MHQHAINIAAPHTLQEPDAIAVTAEHAGIDYNSGLPRQQCACDDAGGFMLDDGTGNTNAVARVKVREKEVRAQPHQAAAVCVDSFDFAAVRASQNATTFHLRDFARQPADKHKLAN